MKISKVCGVYGITNVLNGNFYIGSSIDIRIRFLSHINALKGNKHENQRLQDDYNLMGQNAFVFDVLEIVKKERNEILSREQWHLDFLKPQYNIMRKAGTRLGTPHSEETKKKISEATKGRAVWSKGTRGVIVWTDEMKRKSSISHTGIFKSKETIAKISGKNNSFYGKTHTSQVKERLSQIAKTRVASEENKKKRSESMKGKLVGDKNPMYGKKRSQESIRKQFETRKINQNKKLKT